MADLKASPRNSALGLISDTLARVRDFGDKAKIPFTDMGLGELFMGKTPEEVNEWSYGNSPLQVVGGGTGSYIPQLKQGRGQQVADTVLSAPGLGQMARGAGRAALQFPNSVKRAALDFANASAAANPAVIKRRGGVWDPQFGPKQMTDQLLAGDELGETNPQVLARLRAETNAPRMGINGEAVGNFIRGPLETYFKRDFASPTDRIRMLADEGIVHLNLVDDWRDVPDAASDVPGWQRMGKTDAGKTWEDTADSYISQTPAKKHVLSPIEEFTMDALDNSGKPIKIHPESGEILPSFLNNVPPDEPVHMINQMSWAPQELGITHMIDTLMNSLEAGRLTPEQVMSPRFTIDAAVRHVHEANAQAVKDAEKAVRARMEKLTPIKEYPEGYKWYELPDTADPEAMKLANSIGCEGGWCTKEEWAAKNYGSGGSRLRVLIGPDGKAVTQMTVLPGRDSYTPTLEDLVGSNVRFANEVHHKLSQEAANHPEWLNGMPNDQQSIDFVLKNYPDHRNVKEFLSLDTGPTKAEINEIKGRFNDPPKPEHRPFIQDLIRGGDYGKISDYQNAGLIDMGAFTGNNIRGYMNSDDAVAAVKALQEKNPQYDYSSWIPVLKSWGE